MWVAAAVTAVAAATPAARGTTTIAWKGHTWQVTQSWNRSGRDALREFVAEQAAQPARGFAVDLTDA
jgi:hypothetical protein